MSMRFVVSLGMAAGLALTLGSTPADAGLGQPLSAAAQDGTPIAAASGARLTAKAASASTPAAALPIQSQSIQTPQGASVTEYAGASGPVFAITWRGPFKPDLRQLLGQYFAPFVQGSPRAGLGLTASVVHGDDIVVHSFGRMRNFYGVAWVPSLVPAGFDVAGLQP
ncbi:DUF2844 domain-containing protein [Thiomonas sp.]